MVWIGMMRTTIFCGIFLLVLSRSAPAAQVVRVHEPERDGDQVVFRIEVADAQKVFIAGSFNNWADNQNGNVTDEKYALQKIGDTLYEKRMEIAPGEHKFKFVIDAGQWISPDGFKKDQDENAIIYISENREVSKFPPAAGLSTRPMYDVPASDEETPSARPFLGWFPVQAVNSGEEAVLDLHRFYEPGRRDRLKISQDSRVAVAFDSEKFQLHLQVSPDYSGLLDVPVWALDDAGDSAAGVITISAVRRGIHLFSYKPFAAPKKIVAAGSFNDWNQDKTPMKDPDGDGRYEARVWLDPGVHLYKFVADGNWLPDPENPDTTPDGFGGFNSTIRIEGADAGKAPYIYADHETETDIEIAILDGDESIRDVSVVIQAPSGLNFIGTHERIGNRIRVHREGTPKGSWIRVIVADRRGRASNIVRCRLSDTPAFEWQDGVIYFVFTDRFSNGDTSNDRPVDHKDLLWPANYHGGDFRGIRKRLEEGYFEKLGVNVLWLAPIHKNPDVAHQEYLAPYRWYSGYHGYWPVSSTDVEPRFGDSAELQALVDESHRRGIRVIVDLVLNHVHDSHPYRVLHPGWFGSLTLPDGSRNLRRWDEHSFTTWFEPFLPKFDFSNRDAVRALIDESVGLARGARLDGFRLDAVKHIPPSFWRKFRGGFRETLERERGERVFMVGETFRDRQGIMSFVGPNMLDGQFDFPLYDTVKSVFALEQSGFADLESSLSATERIYGKETLMSPLIGNHDKSRFMAFADGDLPDPTEPDEEEAGWTRPPKVDRPERYRRLKMAQTFLMTIDGVPMVYYGDEFGLSGAGDPDNRRDMRFEEGLSSHEKDALAHFAAVTRVRREHPALRYGSRRAVLVEPDRYAYVRSHFDDRVLVAFNRSADTASLTLYVAPELPDGAYANLLDGRPLAVQDGKINMDMAGGTSAIVVRKPD